MLPEGFGCTQNFWGCTQLVCGLISLTTRLDLLSLLTPLVCVLISLTTRLDLLSLLKRLFWQYVLHFSLRTDHRNFTCFKIIYFGQVAVRVADLTPTSESPNRAGIIGCSAPYPVPVCHHQSPVVEMTIMRRRRLCCRLLSPRLPVWRIASHSWRNCSENEIITWVDIKITLLGKELMEL